ncbi:MerR family transcriptional regulator [Alkalihalobacillus sp. 1P02AB]|uniref:MerR family transcriptional regulator n=1 Tax=Alkalihalobacillus sp. 1P02AB TaxID=3132260 RepID=UPI0039A59934
MTKRTIDYYTNLGLLKVERSSSNYRYYDQSQLERLHYIEDCKAKGMSLESIKKDIFEKFSEEVDIHELRLKIQNLEHDVSEVLGKLDSLNQQEIKQNISKESFSLIQSLITLVK